MLPAEPGEGDPVLGKFRTVSDANRFASRSDITEFSLWTRLKVVGGGSLKEDFKDSDDEEEGHSHEIIDKVLSSIND